MYESFYGLRDQPFRMNPDPDYFFESKAHRRALAHLEYGVHKGEGFIVISGEVGTGKTILIRTLLRRLPRGTVVPGQIVSTQVEADDFLRLVAGAFGISPAGTEKSSVLQSLQRYFLGLNVQGKRALLIIDEAQNLSPRVLEELRLLSNYQVGKVSLLQTFLIGQPELRTALESPPMTKLRQRVTSSFHLTALPREEVRPYVEHRLRRAGWNGQPKIEEAAIDTAFRLTGGIPRQLSALFDRTLLAGFLNDNASISVQSLQEAGEEMRFELDGASNGYAGGAPAQANGAVNSHHGHHADTSAPNLASPNVSSSNVSSSNVASPTVSSPNASSAFAGKPVEASLANISEQLTSIQKSVRQYFLE